MTILKTFFGAGLLALSLVTDASAWPYTQFVVFGDSLSDAGNASAITSGNFPPSPPLSLIHISEPTRPY